MELPPLSLTPKINQLFHQHFPARRAAEIQARIDPRQYDRTLTPQALIQSVMVAYMARLPGTREIAERCSHLLHTECHSTVAEALKQPFMLANIQAYVVELETRGREEHTDDIVALDSMALSLSATRRHKCKKINKKTVGGGVLWSYAVEGCRGQCPVKVLRHMRGAWHDAAEMARGIHLESRGPIYVMDRGLYALGLICGWRREHVRFVVRVKKSGLKYEILRHLRRQEGHPGKGKRLVLDAIVRLGAGSAKQRPVVRLVIVELTSGDHLILATSEVAMSVERVLEVYRKRWHIERFHRYLKDSVGLAHLYSFHENGIEFLLLAALLLALLAWEAAGAQGETIWRMRKGLREERVWLGLGPACKRNTPVPRRAKRKKSQVPAPLPTAQTFGQ